MRSFVFQDGETMEGVSLYALLTSKQLLIVNVLALSLISFIGVTEPITQYTVSSTYNVLYILA